MKHLLFTIIVLLPVYVMAQDTIVVKQLKMQPQVSIFYPIVIDSNNVEKKKIDKSVLLNDFINIKENHKSSTVINADSEGNFELSYTTDNIGKAALQLFYFNIDPDKFCNAKLIITSKNMLEVYVNGKSEKRKESFEDSLSKAKSLAIDLKLEPKRYSVLLKFLLINNEKSTFNIKIIMLNGDSLAEDNVNTDYLRRITINDILEGTRLVSGCSVSPSGRYAIYGYSTVFSESKKVYLQLELREISTKKLCFTFPSLTDIKWVKGKDIVIYTKQSNEGRSLYSLEISSFEEKLLAENIPADNFLFSPDCSYLLYTKSEEIPADKGDLKRVLAPNDRSGRFRTRKSLFLFDLKTQTSQRLTYGHTDISLNDISSDSKKVLLMYYKNNITERPFWKKVLVELDITSLTLDSLLSDPFMSYAKYSPDMKQLLIVGAGEAFNGTGLNIKEKQISNMYDNQGFIYDKENKNIVAITKKFDPSINSAVWSKYDNKIYFTVDDKDRVQVYSYDTKNDSFSKLPLHEDIIREFMIADNAPIAVFQGEGTNNAYRMYSFNLKTKKITLLADPFKLQLDELKLTVPKDWNFIFEDGTTIEGRYYLPYNYKDGNKYPLIVYYYAGTSPTARLFESSYPLQVYSALGYIVYTLQPSGTVGFGQEFSARHVNAWGKKTADEIIMGTQLFCRQHSFVDSTKIGCIGASYGGFMTQYLQTRTDMFSAAVSHAGISNITSYWGEGYWGYEYSAAATAFNYPWNNKDLYIEQSPLFLADKIQTPLLLLHGTADTNVPVGESIQMFNALKILGKQVEFITVDGENHGISNYEKRINWNKTIYAWFAKWLKNEPKWWEFLYPERVE